MRRSTGQGAQQKSLSKFSRIVLKIQGFSWISRIGEHPGSKMRAKGQGTYVG